jgi:hypothetical protein
MRPMTSEMWQETARRLIIIAQSLLPAGLEGEWEEERRGLPPLASAGTPHASRHAALLSKTNEAMLQLLELGNSLHAEETPLRGGPNSPPWHRDATVQLETGSSSSPRSGLQMPSDLAKHALAIGPVEGLPPSQLRTPRPPRGPPQPTTSGKAPTGRLWRQELHEKPPEKLLSPRISPHRRQSSPTQMRPSTSPGSAADAKHERQHDAHRLIPAQPASPRVAGPIFHHRMVRDRSGPKFRLSKASISDGGDADGSSSNGARSIAPTPHSGALSAGRSTLWPTTPQGSLEERAPLSTPPFKMASGMGSPALLRHALPAPPAPSRNDSRMDSFKIIKVARS